MFGYLLQLLGYVMLFALLDYERYKGQRKTLRGAIWQTLYCGFWIIIALALVLQGLKMEGINK